MAQFYFPGQKESDGINVTYASPELGDPEFSSIDDVLMHPEVAAY